MASNVPSDYFLQTPKRPEGFQMLGLSSEDSDCEDTMSPCRPRTHSLFDNALKDVGPRANIRVDYNHSRIDLADVMADLTETCHISTEKPKQRAQNGSSTAMHAGRASSLPYPPPLFRNTDPLRTVPRASATLSSPLQSPLESPITSASVSPTGTPLDDPFDRSVRTSATNDLRPCESFVSLATPSVCTDLESELGSEADTDMDSETEPDTEAEQDAFLNTRREHPLQNQLLSSQQSQRVSPQSHFYKHIDAQVNTATHVPPSKASASHLARETSTPMTRPRYMYHASNRSAIGISFSENENEHSEEGDLFRESTSPAPAPRALRSSFNRGAHLWIPPSKVRRTQSMFATPEQLLHEQVGHIERPMNRLGQPDGTFTGVVGTPACPLSTFTVKQDPFKRINHDTLCRLLDGEFRYMFSEVIVIDCRFEYEYEGGHISGAVNVNSKKQLEQVLFEERVCSFDQSVLLVFHCEHSAYRSPLLASHLRQWDRHINGPYYPKLFYPDVVVLDGGYSGFYAASAHRCEPQNYVGMDHQEHRETCEKEMLRFRNCMRARKMPTTHSGGSAPNLLDFKFPKPAAALRSASVANIELPESKPSGANIFGF